MAIAVIDEQSLVDIAKAIRTKNGTEDTYKPSDMANAILNIEAGTEVVEPILQEKTIIPTASEQIIEPDTDYDGLSKVTVGGVTSDIDSDIKSNNIRKGINILGVTGTMEEYVEPKLQNKSATPTTSSQTITPDEEYDGLSSVSVGAVTNEIDSNIVASNIKKGVSILGVTGTLEEGITPSGTLPITENGSYDVTGYANANVNVASSEGEDVYEGLLDNTITEINSNVKSIAGYACRGMSKITRVNLPNATSIGTYAFYYCTAMTSINAPKVTSLGTYAFYNCKIKNINFPLVTTIAQNSFYSCSSLEKADFGVAGTINQSAFAYASNLKVLILRKTNAICKLATATNAFQGSAIANGTGYVYVPKALIEEYKVATNWSNYATQFRAIEDYPEICGV